MRPIKNLPDSRLSTAVMVVSALMVVVGTVAAPPDGSPIWLLLGWLVGSVALIGVFAGAFHELLRRFFKKS